MRQLTPPGKAITVIDQPRKPEQQQPSIFVVDDDPAVRRALSSVGQLLEVSVVTFSSAEEFLSSYDPSHPGCLVSDIKMPGMTGIELQQRLSDEGIAIPIIMISGHANVRIAVEVMSRGALTLLEKPCRLDEITVHIRQALKIDAERRAASRQQEEARAQLARLTFKEREVLELVANGKTNKEIASTLQLSIRAVEDRRSRAMKKLGARSVVELVQRYRT